MQYLVNIHRDDAVGFLIDRASADGSEIVRGIAVTSLRDRLDYPGVRAALENASRNDISYAVRDLATLALAGTDSSAPQ